MNLTEVEGNRGGAALGESSEVVNVGEHCERFLIWANLMELKHCSLPSVPSPGPGGQLSMYLKPEKQKKTADRPPAGPAPAPNGRGGFHQTFETCLKSVCQSHWGAQPIRAAAPVVMTAPSRRHGLTPFPGGIGKQQKQKDYQTKAEAVQKQNERLIKDTVLSLLLRFQV